MWRADAAARALVPLFDTRHYLRSVLPPIVCAVALAVLLAAARRGNTGVASAAKLVAAATFLWAALAAGALESGFGRSLFAGLVLSALGDALLIPPGQGAAFLLGIGSFLLGHVAYALGFATLPSSVPAVTLAGLAMALVAVATLRWLRPHVPPDLRAAVLGYIAVISVMVVVAIGAAVGGGLAAIAIGAVAFAVSDLSVARDRFVAPGFVNAVWGLPLYFGAQHVLAASAGLSH